MQCIFVFLAVLSQDRHAEFTDVKTHSFMVTTYNLNGKSPKEYLANGVDFNDWLFKVRNAVFQLCSPKAVAPSRAGRWHLAGVFLHNVVWMDGLICTLAMGVFAACSSDRSILRFLRDWLPRNGGLERGQRRPQS